MCHLTDKQKLMYLEDIRRQQKEASNEPTPAGYYDAPPTEEQVRELLAKYGI